MAGLEKFRPRIPLPEKSETRVKHMKKLLGGEEDVVKSFDFANREKKYTTPPIHAELYGCDVRALKNRTKLEALLHSLAMVCGGTLGKTQTDIYQTSDKSRNKKGLSGYAQFPKGHIIVHTFPHEGMAEIHIHLEQLVNRSEILTISQEHFHSKKTFTGAMKKEMMD